MTTGSARAASTWLEAGSLGTVMAGSYLTEGQHSVSLLRPFPDTKRLELHEVQPSAAARATRFAAKNAPAGQRQIRTTSVRRVRAGLWNNYLPAPASASGSGKRRLREVHGQRGLESVTELPFKQV